MISLVGVLYLNCKNASKFGTYYMTLAKSFSSFSKFLYLKWHLRKGGGRKINSCSVQ